MQNKGKILHVLIAVLSIFIVSLIGIIIYDRTTVNNKYKISERQLNIPIFVYHNIVKDSSEVVYDYMQTPRDIFEKQIKGLRTLGYNFITYEELVKYKNNELELNKKSCIVTFDDGYQGIYENAYPIAKKYNIPFTVFVITDTMEKEGSLTWDEAKTMQDSGLVTIASHSTDHPEFTSLTVEQAVNNVNNSYKIIEESLGEKSIKIFTYPYGLYTEEEIVALEKEGYIQNLTDNRINKSKNLDLSRLHRCYPLNDSIFKMTLKLIYRTIRYN